MLITGDQSFRASRVEIKMHYLSWGGHNAVVQEKFNTSV